MSRHWPALHGSSAEGREARLDAFPTSAPRLRGRDAESRGGGAGVNTGAVRDHLGAYQARGSATTPQAPRGGSTSRMAMACCTLFNSSNRSRVLCCFFCFFLYSLRQKDSQRLLSCTVKLSYRILYDSFWSPCFYTFSHRATVFYTPAAVTAPSGSSRARQARQRGRRRR